MQGRWSSCTLFPKLYCCTKRASAVFDGQLQCQPQPESCGAGPAEEGLCDETNGCDEGQKCCKDSNTDGVFCCIDEADECPTRLPAQKKDGFTCPTPPPDPDDTNTASCIGPNGDRPRVVLDGVRYRFTFLPGGQCVDESKSSYEWGEFNGAEDFGDCAKKCVDETPEDLVKDKSFRGVDYNCGDGSCRCLFDRGTIRRKHRRYFDKTEMGEGNGEISSIADATDHYCGKRIQKSEEDVRYLAEKDTPIKVEQPTDHNAPRNLRGQKETVDETQTNETRWWEPLAAAQLELLSAITLLGVAMHFYAL